MIEDLDSIVAAGAALRAGRVSAVTLVEEELARIAKADPVLNAFILVTADAALEDARRADVELRNGQVRGPLHGIPYAVKDIIDVAGLATTANSKIVPVPRADRSAGAVTRLDRVGAVLLGKTSLHEFAIGGPTSGLPFRPARNFWDPTRHPGGSSSGSATAVAAQMVYAAIGTDTGGSVRNPATSSGIVGLKPTYGLVGRSGVFPLSFSLDHVGPMTRSVEDNALVLSAIAGADDADPSSVDLAPSDYLSGLNRGVSGLSIGLVEHFHEEGGGADPELVEALHEAAGMLRAGGARVETCRLPALAEFAACGRAIQFAESYAIHRQWLRERPGDYCELSLKKLLPGAFIPAADYVAAQQARRDLCARYEDALAGFDAIMLLSGFELPARFDQPDEIARTYERHARMPFNVTGAPALAVPVGWSRQGLPLGIQIAGRAFSEAMLFRVGHALEQAVAQQHQGRRPVPLHTQQ